MDKAPGKRDRLEPMDFFYGKCGEHGLKVTPQRIAVYHELAKAKDHPSAEAIFRRLRKALPHISLDTVNRTLLTFSRIGIANVVEGYGEPKRFDSNIHRHHHMRCIKCNSIIDFQSDLYDRIRIPEGIKRQFTVLNKRVVLEGVCRKCEGK
jgi:Fur family peroxide stress response transcriptional regulator